MADSYDKYLTGDYIPLHEGKRVFVDDGPYSGIGYIINFDKHTAYVSMEPRGENKLYGRSRLKEPPPKDQS